MTDNIHVDSSGAPDLSHYKPQYKIDVEKWRHHLKFHDTVLTDIEVHAWVDGFVNFTKDSMNQLAQYALKQAKEREQNEKQAGQ